MTYLKWQDYPAWSQCAGRPALEEAEGELPDTVPTLTKDERAALEARRAALEGATAVEILPLQSLAVGAITGERGALAWGSVILAEYKDHAALEVYPPDRMLGLAALVKYSILHQITSTNVGTPEELFSFGGAVTEAAQLSLNLRASITALEHLKPGEYCQGCRAAYRCPALAKSMHAVIFSPIEALEDPEALPSAVPATIAAEDAWGQYIVPKLPLIEAWVAQVKRAAGLNLPPVVKRRKKRRLKRARGVPESS
jgi:hypothetical protein